MQDHSGITDADVASRALVAFGGNLPMDGRPPEVTVARAMERLRSHAMGPFAASRLWRTPAFPAGSGPDYVNAAAAFDWRGGAAALLEVLHGIEAEFGRTRGARWSARIVDLDLLAVGDAVLPDAETQSQWRILAPERAAQEVPDTLILPHPRLAERGFVLVPLAEVAPDWRHPLTGRSVQQMRDALDPGALAEIVPLGTAEAAPGRGG